MDEEISIQREALLKTYIAELELRNAALEEKARKYEKVYREVTVLRNKIQELQKTEADTKSKLSRLERLSQDHEASLSKTNELAREFTLLRDKYNQLLVEKEHFLLENETLNKRLKKVSVRFSCRPSPQILHDETATTEAARLRERIDQLYATLCAEINKRNVLEKRLAEKQSCKDCEILSTQLKEQERIHASIFDDLRRRDDVERLRCSIKAIIGAKINPFLKNLLQKLLKDDKADLVAGLEEVFLQVAVEFDELSSKEWL